MVPLYVSLEEFSYKHANTPGPCPKLICDVAKLTSPDSQRDQRQGKAELMGLSFFGYSCSPLKQPPGQTH